MHASTRILVAALPALLAGTPGLAQWSSDPLVNLPVADGRGGQVVPLIESTSDGGCYVAWFDDSAGSFQVRLQRLDGGGVEQWPHQGILISDHPQNSALFGWDLAVDAADHAVLVFSDERDGGDLDVHAYRVAPDGTAAWGADGVTLSMNPDFEPAPRVTVATDGDLVFAWQRSPAAGDAVVLMQRLSPAGAPRLAVGGVVVAASAGESPGFVDLAPADGGDVHLAWLRDTSTFASPRHLRVQRFDAAAAPAWPAPVTVEDSFSLPIGYFPKILPDGAGGALVGWHRSDGALFNSFLQHVDGTGRTLLPAGGVAVSTVPDRHHLDPSFARHEASGSVFVFWSERNAGQSQWGVFGQRIAAGGTRLWGDTGVEVLPVDGVYESFPRVVARADGATMVVADSPAGFDRLLAFGFDLDGRPSWPSSPVFVSSAASSKARYPVTGTSSGTAIVAWEDDRSGTVDVFAQAVASDGTLGADPVVGPGRVGVLRVARSGATAGALRLSWDSACPTPSEDHGIQEGPIGSFRDHSAVDCSDDGGDLVEEVVPAAGSRYFLVVPLGGANEGSLGRDSFGRERPVSADPAGRCRPEQLLTACP